MCMSDMGHSKTKLFQEIEKLQDKVVRIISSLPENDKEAYSTLKILKIRDFISFQNTLLVKDVFEEKILSPLMSYFKKLNTQHLHNTRSAMNAFVQVPLYEQLTQIYTISNPSNTDLSKYGTNCKKHYQTILLTLH